MAVRPKKFLGQHFLTNKAIADRIVSALDLDVGNDVLEVGPGMGILTEPLLKSPINLKVVEIDKESIAYLKENFSTLTGRIYEGDFLDLKLDQVFEDSVSIIGNFPYNISSQIFFKVLEYRQVVVQVVGMVQKEVGHRIASESGNKSYGILSVLLQAYFDVEVLFGVKPGSFYPPPRVDSTVLRLKRNNMRELPCDENLFFRLVKLGFQNRRKTLRNALKQINLPDQIVKDDLLNLRAEALKVEDFINLAQKLQQEWNK